MKQQLIENKIITIREQKVILDSDVAIIRSRNQAYQ